MSIARMEALERLATAVANWQEHPSPDTDMALRTAMEAVRNTPIVAVEKRVRQLIPWPGAEGQWPGMFVLFEDGTCWFKNFSTGNWAREDMAPRAQT